MVPHLALLVASAPSSQKLDTRRQHWLTLDIIHVLNTPQCRLVLHKELTEKH